MKTFDRSWLVNIRKYVDVTQKEIAEACGISTSYYCNIEKGFHTPTVKVAERIALFLKFDISEWMTEKEIETN